ncbi:MAG: hypothetical protein M1833_000391 [Piccolia ochrophora]|nr:MAG: hypothetical protein M1833_000391 [Piccolia ochrophora]
MASSPQYQSQYGSSAPPYQQPQQQFGQPSPPVQQAYSPPPAQGAYGSPAPQQGYVQTPPPAQQPHQQPHQQQAAHMAGTAPAVGPHRGPVQEWRNGFWDCCSPSGTCCMGYWCPCILFGKTQHRLKDPTLQSYDTFNGNCIGWWALTCVGLQWAFQMMKRGELREQYNLDGSGFKDCCGAYCCPCCGLVQEEKEVLFRTQGAVQPVPTGAAQGYQKNEAQMQYPPQNVG